MNQSGCHIAYATMQTSPSEYYTKDASVNNASQVNVNGYRLILDAEYRML